MRPRVSLIRTSSNSKAFTLVEVLLASFIFGLTMVAIATVLRTGIRSWRVGHQMSEIMQTARITHDVVLRDLNNILYITENQYNNVFRQQLTQISLLFDRDEDYDLTGRARDARRESRRRERRRRNDDEGNQRESRDPLALDQIAPPLDLTFSVNDGGKTDTVNLARAYQPRWPNDPRTWGIRRVTFYVEDNVLYRKEADPYGYNPGMETNRNDLLHNPAYAGRMPNLPFLNDTESSYGALGGLFNPSSLRTGNWSAGGNLDVLNALSGYDGQSFGDLLIPSRLDVAEPICEGVEVFDVTLGYFQEAVWIEVMDWESGSSRYRNPLDLDFDYESLEDQINQYMQSGGGLVSPEALLGLNQTQADDLPGYMAIQLGVRAPGGKGRLHSFTFFYSFPQAQETDTLILDEMERRRPLLPTTVARRNRRR